MARNMKDSGIEWIGEIPEDWELVPGKYLFKNKKTIAGIAEEKYERLALTLNGVIKRSKINSDGLQPANFMTYQILNKDELVFKLIDLQNISTSRVGISPYKGIVSPAYIILKIINEDVDAKFYYYWYYSLYLNQVFNLLGDAGVRSNINSTELLNIPVPYLSYKRQKFISKELSKIEIKIKNQMKLIYEQIQTLEDYKKSVITEAVTKGLDKNVETKDSGIEWIGKIPKHWSIVKIKYIKKEDEPNSFIDGDWIESNYIKSEGIRYITTGNIGDGQYIEQGNGFVSKEDFELLKCKYAYPGDLIFSRLNAPYGRSCILPNLYNKYVIAVDNVILRTKECYNKNYINYLTQCIGYQMSVKDSASGTTMQRISRTKLGNIQLPFPDTEEQLKIIVYLDKKTKTIDETISTKQKQLQILEEYKKSLIYEYVTGKKEVEDVGTI